MNLITPFNLLYTVNCKFKQHSVHSCFSPLRKSLAVYSAGLFAYSKSFRERGKESAQGMGRVF